MAQVVSKSATQASGSNTVTAIPGTGNTVLLEMSVWGLWQLFLTIAVTVQNLDAFIVEGRVPGGDYFTLTSAITSTPGGLVVAASGTLATTTSGSSAWAAINVRGLDSVRISASAASDGAAVVIQASAI